MNIDATFWVAISFFIFCGGLVYLKVPQKINNALNDQIEKISAKYTNSNLIFAQENKEISFYGKT